ncbi:MAG TPA: outer membrane lipoprotein LolB [Gammaproteobacteria bacterium]|nr:outer membrane lipoprotein LolB [Gammaproteobacteria bacterium]
MIQTIISRLVISLTILVLASCAAIKDQPEGPDPASIEPKGWVAEKKQRQQINVWEIRGRLGVQTETTGGSLDIIWKNDGENYTIRLLAPVGAGNYLVQGDKDQAEIRYPNGSKKTINDIDEVFTSILEVDLPASAVKDWIRGIPSNRLPVKKIMWDKKGHLNRVKQSGWNVEMTRYAGDKIVMPHDIYLSYEGGAEDKELDMRLVLRRWLIDN